MFLHATSANGGSVVVVFSKAGRSIHFWRSLDPQRRALQHVALLKLAWTRLDGVERRMCSFDEKGLLDLSAHLVKSDARWPAEWRHGVDAEVAQVAGGVRPLRRLSLGGET
jgi:hypothetical protein